MILRIYKETVMDHLGQFPAVALLGPRQAGKTTMALQIGEEKASLYLDLENPADLRKLADPELYFENHQEKLIIIDEVHRVPDLFQVLRGVIDRRRRKGSAGGQFLLLGSASMDLLRQSGESLAGRIAYVELPPFGLLETGADSLNMLWVRGGFPDSFLAADDDASMVWRDNFLRTYLERDIPLLGPRIPAETLRRFWTMLAHQQGGLLNAAQLARSLAVDGKTIASYLDLMVDLLLVRRLRPWYGNTRKRLVRSPRIYVRDSGVTHALLGLGDLNALLGHPVAGGSWEGFAIENLLAVVPPRTEASFYRTAAGAEIDLVLEFAGGKKWAVEIKRGLAPKLGKGFHQSLEDLRPDRSFVIYSGKERYPLAEDIEVVGLVDLVTDLTRM